MHVRILYFAAVREVTGIEEEALDLPEGVSTVDHLAELLAVRYPALGPRLSSLRLARNEVFAEANEPLASGDVVALIPPLAGG
jgi:molybdopterin converting factor subunit 1